ncbi:hypothetical protein FOZ63_026086 [Perkinsus olseni]|uniref:Protein arginine methyltransferase 10 n=1 Tax=Perkinsus olseni TaxID=32597 RepID=A0A7J6QS43_PEROL|nr:hypothetical protein FOZ62_024841 [Perkinsus olseni]KAF4711301.1 hypothetical protein FOZ63_026086 [Perkinsus olseni]
MINRVPIYLLVTLPTVINAAPVVGWFVHYAKDYHMHFIVDENQTAQTFVFNAYTRRGPGITPRTHYNYNPTDIDDVLPDDGLPLTRVTDSVYSIGFPPDVLRKWYANIADSLYTAGHVDSKDGFPPAGIQPGDLVTITQTSGDTYTTNFRGETIEFLRRSDVIEYLKPGLFEYEEPVVPHFKLSVYVRYDGEVFRPRHQRQGSVGILVSCDGRPTSRFHFRLVPDASRKPYQRYNVEPADAYRITVGVDDEYRVAIGFGAFDRCTPDSPKGPPPFCGHARIWQPDDRYPSAGIEAGDMTTLTYTSGDTFTTSFRGEKIEFMREANNFAAGSFEYVEPVAPHLKLSYWILWAGSVGIEVTCNGRSTGRRHFKLVRRDQGVHYVRYDVEPVGRGTLDDLKR